MGTPIHHGSISNESAVTFHTLSPSPLNSVQAQAQSQVHRLAERELYPALSSSSSAEGSMWDYVKPWKWTWFSRKGEPQAQSIPKEAPILYGPYGANKPLPPPVSVAPTGSKIQTRKPKTKLQNRSKPQTLVSAQLSSQSPGTELARFPPLYFSRDVEAQIQAVNEAATPILSNVKETRLKTVLVTGLATGFWILDRFDAGMKKVVIPAAEDAVHLALAVYDFPAFLINYERRDIPKKLQEADRRIKAAILEPEFFDLALLSRRLASTSLSSTITHQINEFLKNTPFLSNIEIKNEIIQKLIGLNVANLFANLAEVIQKDPNFPKQNALICLASIILSKIEKHAPQLAAIEQAKRQAFDLYEEIKRFTIPDQNQAQQWVTLLVQSNKKGKFLDPKRCLKVIHQLFPNYDALPIDIKEKVASMILLGRQAANLTSLFTNISEELFTVFFPNKVRDLIFPGSDANIAQIESLQNYANSIIKNQIYDFLFKSYKAMTKNPIRSNAWMNQIKNRVGNHSVEALMQAPTIFITEFIKNYIQSNPNTPSRLTSFLDGFTKEEGAEVLVAKDRGVVPGLNNRPLAVYILQSFRKVLTTPDPVLFKAGLYIKNLIADLTLGLVAKGADLVISKEEQVETDQFFTTVLNRTVENYKSFSKIGIPATEKEKRELAKKVEEFWKNFLADLALPPVVQDLLLSTLTQKIDHYSQLLNHLARAKNAVEVLHSESLKTIKGYPRGKELISLADKISEKMIEAVSEQLQKAEWLDTKGMNLQMEDLFNLYLPGIKVDEELKVWFKANVKALGMSLNAIAPSSYAKGVKKGIQAVLLKSLILVVEKNFKNDPEKFTAQLFHHLYEIAKKAFASLSTKEKQNLAEAWTLQSQLKTLNVERNAIQQEIDINRICLSSPNRLTDLENQTFQRLIILQDKQERESSHIANLKLDLSKKFTILNQNEGGHWNQEKLSRVKEALAYQKEKRLPSDLYSLEVEKAKHSNEMELSGQFVDLLIELRKLSLEHKKILVECLDLEESLSLAFEEEKFLKQNLEKTRSLLSRLQEETEFPLEFTRAVDAVEQVIRLKITLPHLDEQIEGLKKNIDLKIRSFQHLIQGLTALLGIDQGIQLIPEGFRNEGLILSAKNQLSRLLFEHLYSTILPILELEENQIKLHQLTGDSLLGNISHIAAKEVGDLLSLKRWMSNDLSSPSKIQMPISIPKEVLKAVNIALPSLTDLEALITPQLHELVQGNDKALKNTQGIMQRYIESMIVKILIRVIQKNGPTHVLDNIVQKINECLAEGRIQGLPNNEAVIKIADHMMQDVLGIASKEDLEGVFPPLKQIVFEQVKAQVRVQLTPYILPLIERESDRATLDKLSRGRFLGNLCSAITQDMVGWIVPRIIKDYSAISQKMFKELVPLQTPTPKQIKVLSNQIKHLVELSSYNPNLPKYIPTSIQNKTLLDLFQKIAGVSFTAEQRKFYMSKLKESKIKEEIGYVIATPEEIMARIVERVPALGSIRNELVKELQSLTRLGVSTTNQNITAFVQNYVEAFLLKAFINIAKQNPPSPGKDVGIVVTEKCVGVLQEKIGEIRKKVKEVEERFSHPLSKATSEQNRDSILKDKQIAIKKEIQKIAQSMHANLLRDVFGINPNNPFEGIPTPIAAVVYEIISKQMGDVVQKLIFNSYAGMQSLESSRESVETARRSLANMLGNNWAEVISQDMGRMILDSTTQSLNSAVNGGSKGVKQIGEGVRDYLEELARNNVEMAKTLLGYTKTVQLERILDQQLQDVQSMSEVDKVKAAQLIGNMILEPMNQVIAKLLAVEEERKAAFNQKLATHLLNTTADHLKLINLAKLRAIKLRGNDKFTHEDFMRVAGEQGKRESSVPLSKPDYYKSIQDIIRRLKIKPLTVVQKNQLEDALAKLVEEDNGAVKPLRIRSLIEELEKILGYKLTEAQIKRMKKPDEEGLTLKERIRNEAAQPLARRKEFLYEPVLRKLIKVFFPNGKHDLTFVAPELRAQVWSQIKIHGTTLMHMMMESLLNRDNITNGVVNSLEIMCNNLKKEPDLDLRPYPKELSDLDKACGSVLLQCVDMAKLPQRLVKMMKDPATGEILPAFQQAFGRTMLDQFNEDFIKRSLKNAFETMAARGREGKPFFSSDLREEGVMAKENIKNRAEAEKKLISLTHELVDVTLEYQLKSQWKQFEYKVNTWADKTYANVKNKLGWFSNVVNGMIEFFKIIYVGIVEGFFSLGHWVASHDWVKKKIYEYVNLDENRKIFMDVLRNGPVDQPGPSAYAVYNENLISHLLRGMDTQMNSM